MADEAHDKRIDWKHRLNRLMSHRRRKVSYRVLTVPAQTQYWTVGLFLQRDLIAEGSDISRTRAEQLAAKAGLERMHHRLVAERRAMGRRFCQKGEESEARVLAAFSAPTFPLPDWFMDARKATDEEDAHGVDVVISTRDLGDLLLQVKSSRTGALQFLSRGARSRLIGIIVVRPDDIVPDILRNGIAALELLRQEILRLRAGGSRRMATKNS